jgi:hypothetical protein
MKHVNKVGTYSIKPSLKMLSPECEKYNNRYKSKASSSILHLTWVRFILSLLSYDLLHDFTVHENGEDETVYKSTDLYTT